MRTETWYKIWCPFCDHINWVCNGDASDLTAVDVDGFRCCDCGNDVSLDGTDVTDGDFDTAD